MRKSSVSLFATGAFFLRRTVFIVALAYFDFIAGTPFMKFYCKKECATSYLNLRAACMALGAWLSYHRLFVCVLNMVTLVIMVAMAIRCSHGFISCDG
jgi:hypothetical protein